MCLLLLLLLLLLGGLITLLCERKYIGTTAVLSMNATDNVERTMSECN